MAFAEAYLKEAFVAVSWYVLLDELRKCGLRKRPVRWPAKQLKGCAQRLAISGRTRGHVQK